MSNFNFSPRTIAALVMGLGVSFYATAGIGKLKIISADAQRFEAEIPIVDEPVPDSASVRLANSSQYGLPPNSDQANQLSFSRQGDRILVDGPMPSQGSEPLRFALEVSWPEGSLVREFQVQPLAPAGIAEADKTASEEKTAKRSAPQKKKAEASDGSKAIQPDDAKLDTLKLGDLKVVSALGQPLSVEVDIYGNAVRQNSKNIKVQVFPDVSIAGNDPDLMQTLSTLQYRIEKRPSGKHVLKLRSSKAVSEPILPLQIEAVAGNERSVRQYTVLLDPAGYQVASRGNAHAGSTDEATTTPKRHRAAVATGRHADRSLKPLKVYRVLKGDSLSDIAGKMHGREGLAERMQQLKDANPDAFIRGDINLLRAGATLHYPAHWKLSASHNVVRSSSAGGEEESAAPETAVTERPARSSVRSARHGTRHAAAPKPTESSMPAPAPANKPAAAPATTTKPAATPAVKATPTAKPATSPAQATAPAAAKPAVPAKPATATPAPARPATPAAKPAAAPAPANTAPAAPIAKAAQPKPVPATQPAPAVQPAPKAGVTPPPPAVVAPATASAGVAQVASTPIQATASAAAGETPEKLARVTELKARLAEQDAQLKKADATASALQAELAKLNPGTAPAAPAPKPEEEEDLFALVGDYYRPIGIGAVGLLAISGGWYALRRRRKKQQSGYESLEGMTGEVSGLALTTLMSVNQPGAVDLDMTDPLVEAENLLHEGSTGEALDILREGLTREPMRQDVRLRLLEILARNNEQHAFVEEALVAKTLFGVNSPLWQRTVELAQSLNPVPDLFANGAGKAGANGQRGDKGLASPSASAGA